MGAVIVNTTLQDQVMMRVLLLAPLLLAPFASAEKKNVLWIGNSFTWYIANRANIIAQAGGHEINSGEKSNAAWKWSQHADPNEDTLDTIANGSNDGPWDIVVLQEQSQISQPQCAGLPVPDLGLRSWGPWQWSP